MGKRKIRLEKGAWKFGGTLHLHFDFSKWTTTKKLFGQRRCLLEKTKQIVLNDLLKPFISMFVGLFWCMFLLGEEWRCAKGYAIDVASTGVLVVVVVGVMIIRAGLSYGLIRLVNKKVKK